VLVALLVLRSAWRLVREAGRTLLEQALGIDMREIGTDLVANLDELLGVRHGHVRPLTQERPPRHPACTPRRGRTPVTIRSVYIHRNIPIAISIFAGRLAPCSP
jgi:Co/Zn/Cd efflux system component